MMLMMIRLISITLICFFLNLSSNRALPLSSNSLSNNNSMITVNTGESVDTSTINDATLSPLKSSHHNLFNHDVVKVVNPVNSEKTITNSAKINSKPASESNWLEDDKIVTIVKDEQATVAQQSNLKQLSINSTQLDGSRCKSSPCKHHRKCLVVNRNDTNYDEVYRRNGYKCICGKEYKGFNCDRETGSRVNATFISSVTFFSVLAFYIIILLIGFVLKAKKARATKGKYSPSSAEDKNIATFVLQQQNFERLI